MHKIDNDKCKKASVLIVIFLLTTLTFIPVTQSNEFDTQLCYNNSGEKDFSIVVNTIQEIQQIDPGTSADWQLRMYVNGERKDIECEGDFVTLVETKTWKNIIQEGENIVSIKMELLEIDLVLHDIADISACYGGGEDDTEDFDAHRGAVFQGVYNIASSSWESESDELMPSDESGLLWYCTSGAHDIPSENDENDASIWFSVFAHDSNNPPIKPEKPSGPTEGGEYTTYEFTTRSADPNGDEYRIGWDWNGDGDIDEFTDFLNESGVYVTAAHAWDTTGVYNVRTIAVDDIGMPSYWSNQLEVKIYGAGGLSGFSREEWALGHIYSWYLNHEDTQRLIEDIETAEEIIDIIVTFLDIIEEFLDFEIDEATTRAIVEAIFKLSTSVLRALDQGEGIYFRVYVIDIAGAPFPAFAYVWSQTEGYSREDSTPPEKPNAPQGPARGFKDVDYQYTTSCVDEDSEQMVYLYDWGDGNYSWNNWFSVNTAATVSYSWAEDGTYLVRVKAFDDQGFESGWSDALSVKIGNEAPYKPDTPFGDLEGKPGDECTIRTNEATDPDGDEITVYEWDLIGDDSIADETTSESSITYSWNEKGTYTVRVRAIDEFGAESPWSNPASVTMPKSKITNMMPLMLRFAHGHSNLLQILKQIFRL